MTEPVKMWAVVRDNGETVSVRPDEKTQRDNAEILNDTSRWLETLGTKEPEATYTVKPCTVEIDDDE